MSFESLGPWGGDMLPRESPHLQTIRTPLIRVQLHSVQRPRRRTAEPAAVAPLPATPFTAPTLTPFSFKPIRYSKLSKSPPAQRLPRKRSSRTKPQSTSSSLALSIDPVPVAPQSACRRKKYIWYLRKQPRHTQTLAMPELCVSAVSPSKERSFSYCSMAEARRPQTYRCLVQRNS